MLWIYYFRVIYIGKYFIKILNWYFSIVTLSAKTPLEYWCFACLFSEISSLRSISERFVVGIDQHHLEGGQWPQGSITEKSKFSSLRQFCQGISAVWFLCQCRDSGISNSHSVCKELDFENHSWNVSFPFLQCLSNLALSTFSAAQSNKYCSETCPWNLGIIFLWKAIDIQIKSRNGHNKHSNKN